VHLHIPEGATPKDGPSAGITMATALLSLVENRAIRPYLAMTGELSLTGQVLPIGGLKEKTIAARRNGMKDIIIPKANVRDLDDIPEHVRKGITFHPVSRMEDVIELVFPPVKSAKSANAVKLAEPVKIGKRGRPAKAEKPVKTAKTEVPAKAAPPAAKKRGRPAKK